jgi:hypothetical protein
MSNSFVVNSAGLNSSGFSVVAALIAATALSVTGTATANIRTAGTSVGNIATITTAQASQVHNGVAFGGSCTTEGNTSSIRLAGYITKVDYSNITGSMVANTIAAGNSLNYVETSGAVCPNYLIEGSITETAITSLDGQVEPLRLKITSTNNINVSITGYLVTPRIVTIEDLFVITRLDGYCIPANELGYGYGNIDTEVVCNAVRIVPVTFNMGLWATGPSLITNNAGYYKGNVELKTTGLVNVAIKGKNYNHLIWYYEDWLFLNILNMTVDAKVYKHSAFIAAPSLNLVYDVDATRRATARLEPITIKIAGTFSLEKRSGLITEDVLTGLKNAEEFYYIVLKSPSVNVALTTTGNSLIANTLVFGYSTSNSAIVGNINPNAIISASIDVTYLTITGNSTGTKLLTGNATGICTTSGNVLELILKRSYGLINTNVTGNTTADVMYTCRLGSTSLNGFCIGQKIQVSNLSVGSVSMAVFANDTRLAVKGNVLNVWNTTSTSNADFRLAVRYDETSYWNTLEDSGNDYRLAVRLESHETLPTSGTLFDVVNLFVRADETRQMSVAPSPFKGKTTQNYIEVVA